MKERKGFDFDLDTDRSTSARVDAYFSEEKAEKIKTRSSLF